MNAAELLCMKQWMGKSLLTWSLIVINLVGFLFGMYYYWPQLSATPLGYWLLIIDCPLFVLLFALILFFDVRDPFWNFFVSVGLAKYGLWTAFVIVLLWPQFSLWSPVMYPLLAIAHVGMAFEFVFLLSRMRPGMDNYRVIPVFLLLDYFDYFRGMHPWLPQGAPITLIFLFSVASSLVIPLLLTASILYHQRHKPLWGSASHPQTAKVTAASAGRRPKSGK